MLSSCACKPMNCRLIGTSKSTVGVGFAAGFARRGSLQSRDCNACASSSSPPSPAPPSPSPAARKSRLTLPLKLPAKLLTLRPTLRLLLLTPALRLRKPPLTRALPRRCNPSPQGQVTDRKGRDLHGSRPFSHVQRESPVPACVRCSDVAAQREWPPLLQRRGLGVVPGLAPGGRDKRGPNGSCSGLSTAPFARSLVEGPARYRRRETSPVRFGPSDGVRKPS